MSETANETFTLDELLLALSGAAGDEDSEPGGVRLEELCAATGRNVAALRRDLRKLIDAGKVESVKVWYTRIDNTRIRVSAYRVVRHEHGGTGGAEEAVSGVVEAVLGGVRDAGADRGGGVSGRGGRGGAADAV